MKIVGNKVADQVKKVFVRLDIFLTAIGTKLTGYFSAAIEAVVLSSVLFMTHVE